MVEDVASEWGILGFGIRGWALGASGLGKIW